MIESATALLRGAGVRSLNFDLMYGLPGQTMDDLRDTLMQTAALGADRVALFGYAHVPHLIPRQRRIDPSALPMLQPYVDAGLCGMEGEDLVIHPDGLPCARSIAARFDPYRRDSLRRFSSAV